MTRLASCARRARIGLGTLFFALLAIRSADAQTDSAAARALFSEGRKLMEKERFEEACPKFEESLRLDHGMGTQFNLAHCWEKLGRTASAWALFLDVAAAARAGNQPQREAAARERAKALESKLSRLRIEVPEPAPDMKVTRDEQEVGPAAWGTAMPVDPGEHVIRAAAPGKQAWSHEVQVPAAPRTFSVKVPTLKDEAVPIETADAAETAATAQTVSADVGPERGRGSNGQVVAAWVIGGVGVAALVGGTVFALQSRSDNAEALELCLVPTPQGDRCANATEQAEHEALVEDAKRARLFSYVGFGLGGAALIGATILYVTADAGGDEPSAGGVDAARRRSADAIQLAPLVASDAWGAVVSGQF